MMEMYGFSHEAPPEVSPIDLFLSIIYDLYSLKNYLGLLFMYIPLNYTSSTKPCT